MAVSFCVSGVAAAACFLLYSRVDLSLVWYLSSCHVKNPFQSDLSSLDFNISVHNCCGDIPEQCPAFIFPYRPYVKLYVICAALCTSDANTWAVPLGRSWLSFGINNPQMMHLSVALHSFINEDNSHFLFAGFGPFQLEVCASSRGTEDKAAIPRSYSFLVLAGHWYPLNISCGGLSWHWQFSFYGDL